MVKGITEVAARSFVVERENVESVKLHSASAGMQAIRNWPSITNRDQRKMFAPIPENYAAFAGWTEAKVERDLWTTLCRCRDSAWAYKNGRASLPALVLGDVVSGF